MSRLHKLKQISSKAEFANLLAVSPVFLTNCLYRIKPENQYTKFEIEKKTGGKRIIHAPLEDLKSLQKKTSILLMECIDIINKEKYPTNNNAIDKKDAHLKIKINGFPHKQPTLSHGFMKDRSIITNAMMHIGKVNVLNIDLEDFFGSFNFGRVRGFFIKNNEFKLNKNIATIIAQIACHENKLPQGSPCSPVITNLITHSLDINLSSLARKYKCTYTRYADDITFSSRLSLFPSEIMREDKGKYNPSKKLRSEIRRSGFSINNSKTRVQYKHSRQEVTGLTVNKKPNVKKDYLKKIRTKCHHLFKTGEFFTIENDIKVKGSIKQLEGQLNFIDMIDRYNRIRQKKMLKPEYQAAKIDINTKLLLTSREKNLSDFLFYKNFHINEKPIILCEGKTDNIYLKSAIKELSNKYPLLSKQDNSKYELLVSFFNYNIRVRFLLELYGGSSYLFSFINNFQSTKRKLRFKPEVAPMPVIVLLDNDEGTKSIRNLLSTDKSKKKSKLKNISIYPEGSTPRDCDFIHVGDNLYVVFTPLYKEGDSDIECFFDEKTRLIKDQNQKCFNTIANRTLNDLSKNAFAENIVAKHKKIISFSEFQPLLDRITNIIRHYSNITKSTNKLDKTNRNAE